MKEPACKLGDICTVYKLVSEEQYILHKKLNGEVYEYDFPITASGCFMGWQIKINARCVYIEKQVKSYLDYNKKQSEYIYFIYKFVDALLPINEIDNDSVEWFTARPLDIIIPYNK